MSEPPTYPTDDGGAITGRVPTRDNYQRALDADNDGQPDYTTEIITMRTALEAIPRPIRLAAYLLYAIGGPVMIYLHSKQLVGPEEISLWLGIGTVFGITAAGNVQVGAS